MPLPQNHFRVFFGTFLFTALQHHILFTSFCDYSLLCYPRLTECVLVYLTCTKIYFSLPRFFFSPTWLFFVYLTLRVNTFWLPYYLPDIFFMYLASKQLVPSHFVRTQRDAFLKILIRGYQTNLSGHIFQIWQIKTER